VTVQSPQRSARASAGWNTSPAPCGGLGSSLNTSWSARMWPQPPGGLVHDLHPRAAPAPRARVPRAPGQLLAVLPRLAAHDLAVHHQVHAGDGGMVSAADPQVQVAARQGKRGRYEAPGRAVAAVHAVGQAAAQEAVDRLLAADAAVRRPGPERLPLHAPTLRIGSLVEVRQQRLRGVALRRHRAADAQPLAHFQPAAIGAPALRKGHARAPLVGRHHQRVGPQVARVAAHEQVGPPVIGRNGALLARLDEDLAGQHGLRPVPLARGRTVGVGTAADRHRLLRRRAKGQRRQERNQREQPVTDRAS
jgi:hypothetical protein